MGASWGPDQVGRGQLGARQGQQGPDGCRGTGGKMVGWALEVGWGHGGGTSDKGWGSRHGMMGYQSDDGVPGRGRATTFTSHQSGIFHSLIFGILFLCPSSSLHDGNFT